MTNFAFIGHLTKDTNVFANKDGSKTLKFTVAENTGIKDNAGEEIVNYYPLYKIVKADSKLDTYLTKGKYLSIEGRPTMSKTWTDKNGTVHYPEVQLYAVNVSFLNQAKREAVAEVPVEVPAGIEA